MPDHPRDTPAAPLKAGVGAADGYGVRALVPIEPGPSGAVIGSRAPVVRP